LRPETGGSENASMSTVLKDVLSLGAAARLQLLLEEIWDSLTATPEAIPLARGR
jgi:hypothetical protein